MPLDLARLFADPFFDAWHRVARALPPLAAAALILLFGMVSARGARALVDAACAKLRLDDYCGRAGINELCARLGLGKSPAGVFAFATHWFVLIVFIVTAANAVNMTMVAGLLDRFAAFLPSLIAAVLILFGGLLFGRLVAQILNRAAEANAVRGGRAAAAGAYAVVVGYSALSALEQIGAKPQLVLSAAQILLGSAGLALAIAFGLGARDIAAELLRDLVRRKTP
jgi:hypothetical protein